MSDNLPFKEVRVIFKKTGAAMWFSHLDLARSMSRALRRSKLELWMSQGFTPRPHIVFTPPLSLGYSSECEIMDFRLTPDAELDKSALMDCFPPALMAVDVYTPTTKIKDIGFAKYQIKINTTKTKAEVLDMFSKPVMMVKKTKRSESEVDITEFIRSFDVTECENGLCINAVLCCSQDKTLNPSYILSALGATGSVVRTGFLDLNLKEFK